MENFKRDPYNKPAIVYVAINQVNSKKYFGITTRSLESRKGQHIRCARYGHPTYFAAAIRKYGEGNFIFNKIYQCDTYDEAQFIEKGLISIFRPEYNLTKGGEGVLGLKKKRNRSKEQDEGLILAKIAAAIKNGKPVICTNDGLNFISGGSAATFYGIDPQLVHLSCNGRTLRNGYKFVYRDRK